MLEKRSRNNGYRTALWTMAILMGLALTLSLTPAQDVILNPVEISGQVRVGTEELDQVNMRATSGSFLATQLFMPDAADLTTVNYSLTVDVPAGGDRTYAVQPESIFMDQYFDRLILLPEDVLVADGVPAVQDFIVDPGYIEGTITITGGEVLTNVIINGLYPESTSSQFCQSRFHAPCFAATTTANRNFAYRMAVPAGTGIRVIPRVFLESGAVLILDEVLVDIGVGETVVQDFEVESPTGSIVGMLEIPGAETPNNHIVFVDGTAQKFLDVPVEGPYALTGLPDGDYSMRANSYFGDPSSLNTFGYPNSSFSPSISVNIANGEEVTVDISTAQAFLQGAVTVSDSADQNDLTNLYVGFQGVSQESFGGWTVGSIPDPVAGTYNRVASQGTWRNNQLSFVFEPNGTQLADQFRESINLSYSALGTPGIQVTTGETSTYDVNVPMGKVVVRFGVLGGLPLSDPRLELGCTVRNESGQSLIFVSGRSNGLNQTDVTEAVTSFLAPGAGCLVTARAVVDGTLTSFGQVEVEVEPGVTKELEVGAPTLIIDYPAPDLEVDTPILVVLGRASDDVAVAAVTINGGAPLALTSTGNQDDPNEVSFTGQELSLVPGANVIETTAEDEVGNTTTDTRTVFYVTEGSPPTLNWTPADGTTTSDPAIDIEGTADDEVGIASITVNGTEVSFVSTGNSTQPNEVSFSIPGTLSPGANDITVVATNLDELQTSQTHTVTLLADNTAPEADAGDDIRQFCDGPCDDDGCGTEVTLDGSGSSDADGNDLTYTWTGPFPEGEGTVTGVTPVVTLPLGTYEITLTVDDGTAQSTDTVLVTVEVKVVGLKPPLAGLVRAGSTPPMPRRAFNPRSTLSLRFSLYCDEHLLSDDDVAAPEIVALMDETGTAVDLGNIDLDTGNANGNTLFFRHDDEDGQWIYNLRAKSLTPGATYTITIRMPGDQDYQARFELRDKAKSRRPAGETRLTPRSRRDLRTYGRGTGN